MRVSPHGCHLDPGLELWILPYTDMLKKTQRFPKAAILSDALHEKQSQTLLESLATHGSCETHRLSALPKARLNMLQADPEPGLDNQGMALLHLHCTGRERSGNKPRWWLAVDSLLPPVPLEIQP